MADEKSSSTSNSPMPPWLPKRRSYDEQSSIGDLPFVTQFRHWEPPTVDGLSGGALESIGRECAAHFATLLHANPDVADDGWLFNIVEGIDFADKTARIFCAMGFTDYLEHLIVEAVKHVEPFVFLDRLNAERMKLHCPGIESGEAP